MVIEKFSTELQIKLVAKLGYALLYMLRLNSEIALVIKSVLHNGTQSYKNRPARTSF